MQKKLIALAIAAAASSTAFAQTNVQIYGIADVGYVGVDTDGANFKHNINSGVLSTSRIGFKGAEDLGNGLKAIFTLEYGLLLDQNTSIGASNGGVADARQQFVGLTGGFGTVVAGRLQTAGLDFTVAGSALGGSAALGAINRVNDNSALGGGLINAGARANNAVAYISPSFGGLTLAVNHARAPLAAEGSEPAKGTDASASLIAADYKNGAVSAGAVYGVYNQKDALAGLLPVKGKAKEWGVRAGYDFGFAKLQAAYQRQKLELPVGGDVKDNKWVISATVPVTAKIGVIAEYAQAKVNDGDDKNKAFTLAATYSLSKRTTAYAGFVGIRPNHDVDTNIYGAGLRHAF
jgi:predicted porin